MVVVAGDDGDGGGREGKGRLYGRGGPFRWRCVVVAAGVGAEVVGGACYYYSMGFIVWVL